MLRPLAGGDLVKLTGPYAPRVYHRAKYIGPLGVSALCYAKPHPINLSKRQSWTIRDEAVTCPRCKKLLAANRVSNGGGSVRDVTEAGG